MKEWVTQKVNQCDTCQHIKRGNQTLGHTNLVPSETPSKPFDSIAINTFGPLPKSTQGNRYVIVIQCLFSRYVCLYAVPDNNDINVVNCLSKVIGEHGIFKKILSDNVSPYSGTLIRTLANHLVYLETLMFHRHTFLLHKSYRTSIHRSKRCPLDLTEISSALYLHF